MDRPDQEPRSFGSPPHEPSGLVCADINSIAPLAMPRSAVSLPETATPRRGLDEYHAIRWLPRGGATVSKTNTDTIAAIDAWQISHRGWRNRVESVLFDLTAVLQSAESPERPVRAAAQRLATAWTEALVEQAADLHLSSAEREQYIATLRHLCPWVARAFMRGESKETPLPTLAELLPPPRLDTARVTTLLTSPQESVRPLIFRPRIAASPSEAGVLGEWLDIVLCAAPAETPEDAESWTSRYSGSPGLRSQSRQMSRVTVAPDGTRHVAAPNLSAPAWPAETHRAGRLLHLALVEHFLRIPGRAQMSDMIAAWQSSCNAWFDEARQGQWRWTPTLLDLAAACEEAPEQQAMHPTVRRGAWGQSQEHGSAPSLQTPLATPWPTPLTATGRERIWRRRTPQALRLRFAAEAREAMDPVWLEARSATLEPAEIEALTKNPHYSTEVRHTLLRAGVTTILRDKGRLDTWLPFLLAARRDLTPPWVSPKQEAQIEQLLRRNTISPTMIPLSALSQSRGTTLFTESDPESRRGNLRFQALVCQQIAPGIRPEEWEPAMRQMHTASNEPAPLGLEGLVALWEHVPPEVPTSVRREWARRSLLSSHKTVREAAMRAIGRHRDTEDVLNSAPLEVSSPTAESTDAVTRARTRTHTPRKSQAGR